MALAQAFDAACAALIARGCTPDMIELSQATYDARLPDIVDAVGFDPPAFYYYQGTQQLGFNIDDSIPQGELRVTGTTRVLELVQE